jgi:SAM-dependent methyltransferase
VSEQPSFFSALHRGARWLYRRLPFHEQLYALVFHTQWRRLWYFKVVKTRCGLESLRNWLLDRKYGGSCGGAYPTRFEEIGAKSTSSIDYYQLSRLFHEKNGVVIRESDVLVDVGCGKGRVINWWLHQALRNKIVGIELDERFARFAAKRLKPYANVRIVCGNALDNVPEDGTVFFLFNPFHAPVVEAFKDRLYSMFHDRGNVTIVYCNCKCLDLFRNDPNWVVQPPRLRTFYPCAVIRLKGGLPPAAPARSASEGQTLRSLSLRADAPPSTFGEFPR